MKRHVKASGYRQIPTLSYRKIFHLLYRKALAAPSSSNLFFSIGSLYLLIHFANRLYNVY